MKPTAACVCGATGDVHGVGCRVAMGQMPRRNKYGARRTTVEGRTFDSAKEARRYQELAMLQRTGEIMGLACQVRYRLDVNGVHICDYLCDFQWREPDGTLVVEDVKSKATRTRLYQVKARLLLALHGITVRET